MLYAAVYSYTLALTLALPYNPNTEELGAIAQVRIRPTQPCIFCTLALALALTLTFTPTLTLTLTPMPQAEMPQYRIGGRARAGPWLLWLLARVGYVSAFQEAAAARNPNPNPNPNP